MFIQTEDTPNPATLKFLPGRDVLGTEHGPLDMADAAAAAVSPLAEALFKIEGVRGVFLGRDFVTVTKDDRHGWQALKPQLLGVIMDHFVAGKPVLAAGAAAADSNASAEGDSEIVKQIREILDVKVRPAVAQDGGDITFQSFEDGVVYLHLKGSCAGCPSSTATLKAGIENMLKHYIPEVKEVRQTR